jgi:hypothetical protein
MDPNLVSQPNQFANTSSTSQINNEHPADNLLKISKPILAILIIVIIAISILIGLLGGFIFFHQSKEDKSMANEISQQTEEAQIQDSSLDESGTLDGWTTYNDPQYSVELPPGVTYQDGTNARAREAVFANFDVENDNRQLSETDFMMNIEIQPTKKTLDELYDNDDPAFTNKTFTAVNNNTALKTTFKSAVDSFPEMDFVYVNSQGYTYSFVLLNATGTNREIFDNILNTVVFKY